MMKDHPGKTPPFNEPNERARESQYLRRQKTGYLTWMNVGKKKRGNKKLQKGEESREGQDIWSRTFRRSRVTQTSPGR